MVGQQVTHLLKVSLQRVVLGASFIEVPLLAQSFSGVL
jgi:hypothetical protein